MCNYMITANRQCRLHPNKELCHIHKAFLRNDHDLPVREVPKKVLQNKNIEITRLCKALGAKNNELRICKELISNQEAKIATISSHNDELSKLLIIQKEKIEKMQADYDLYQIIKKYENEKHRLIAKNLDIYGIRDSKFHELRKLRNKVVHELTIST